MDWRRFAAVAAAHGGLIAAFLYLRPSLPVPAPTPPIIARLLVPAPPATQPSPTPPSPADLRPPMPTPQPIEAPRRAPPRPPIETPTVLQAPEASPSPTTATPAPTDEPDVASAATDTVPGEPDLAPAQAAATPVDAGELALYMSAIMRELRKHKVYPRELKKSRTQGTVVLRFTLDRDGRLLSSRVTQGSGSAELDRAALEMLERAEPLPAIPDSIDRSELVLAIPVEYSLITDR
jgi:protein TonB